MVDFLESEIHEQLIERRSKLESALVSSPQNAQLSRLLSEVDAAIASVDKGAYGLCQSCREPIESELLCADPLAKFCLDHMSPDQQRALEMDLVLASKIQNTLLPKPGFQAAGWETAFHYEGAGPVSGDYCDILSHGDNLYFTIGDVSGKGVAASMLMAHLELPLDQVVERMSRMFCQSSLPTHFATLVLGKANEKGEVEICNAGHPPPLLIHGSEIEEIGTTSLPLGMFCDEHFTVGRLRLDPGDTILIYTDGLSEAQNSSGDQYGTKPVFEVVRNSISVSPEDIISACVKDVIAFRGSTPKTDDLTVMAIRRAVR
jgi:sigma-B regulation protein RsbU (phosphoserine phosphatase)